MPPGRATWFQSARSWLASAAGLSKVRKNRAGRVPRFGQFRFVSVAGVVLGPRESRTKDEDDDEDVSLMTDHWLLVTGLNPDR